MWNTSRPLSNGGFAQLTWMARHAGLPWDCIISTDLFRSYKPDPITYLGAVALLGLPPDRVMLVAAHPADLRAAQAQGLRDIRTVGRVDERDLTIQRVVQRAGLRGPRVN